MKQFLEKALLMITGITLLTGCTAPTEETTQEVFTSEYVTSDGSITVNLPGNDWQIDEETEDLYIFSSSDGLVMLSHSENAAGELYPDTESDLGMILDIEGYYSEGYEVAEFEQLSVGPMKSFKSVIKYIEKNAMYDCGILHGVLIGNDVYMASAMLTTDEASYVEAMKNSLFAYVWEMDEELMNPVEIEPASTVTPEPTPEATPEPTPEATPEPTPEVTPEATPEPTPKPKRIVTPVPESDIKKISKEGVCHSSAYVRNAPDNGSDVIGSVEEGQTVTITGEVRNWYRIQYSGEAAYVCKDYIK